MDTKDDAQLELESIKKLAKQASYLHESLAKSYLNAASLKKSEVEGWLETNGLKGNSLKGLTIIFFNQEGDCSYCIDNELFWLDSLSNKSLSIFVYRQSIDSSDSNFFGSYLKESISINGVDAGTYDSFFAADQHFPFYIFYIKKMNEYFYFVPDANLPELRSEFYDLMIDLVDK